MSTISTATEQDMHTFERSIMTDHIDKEELDAKGNQSVGDVPTQNCKWKMKIATAATFIFRIQPTLSNFLVSWLKPSFMTESTPCGFPFWPPQDIRIRKQGCYLRTAQSYSLIVQSKHHLSHFSALLHHPLFRSFSTIDL